MATVGDPPRRRPPPGPARILAVRCPRWPVRSLGTDERGPVAVVAGGSVVAASAGAAAAGVRPGLRRRDAEVCCPDLVVLARDVAAEREAFEPVLSALETFGVPVTVRAPGWAALPVRGPARRHGGEAGLAAAVDAVLGRLGPPGPGRRGAPGGRAGQPDGRERWWRIGVADGHLAAGLAAWRRLVVPAGGTAAFLAPLPVELLGDPALAEMLRRLGLETIGAFAQLDQGVVGARFGRGALALHAVAAGREAVGPAGRPPQPPAQVERRLDPPTGQLETALFVARGLADELVGSLRRRGLACRLLAVEVELADGRRLERRWSGTGSASPPLVAERLRAQLESLGRHPGSPGVAEPDGAAGGELAAVRLVALEAVPDGGDQRSLWGRQRTADDERVARAVARLDGLLGPGAVWRVASGGGRGPAERACRFRFDEPPPGPLAPAPWPGRLPAPSPAVVPVTPVPATLVDAAGAPVRVDGRGALSAPPAGVALGAGPTRAVGGYAGPFPADERWWEPGDHRRRARLQVVVAGGAAYLLALERGAWSLEGTYD